MELLQQELTDKILKAFYTVYNKMGYGFSEKIYENSLVIEMQKLGLVCQQQRRIPVFYDSYLVGEYYLDITVNNLVILELKAVKTLAPEHEAQLFNYLRATHMEVGYVLVFGEKPQFKRVLYTNDRKHNRFAA